MNNPIFKRLFKSENISLAVRYIQGNVLRTILTILVIVFGIMSLVGMLTAINGLKNSLLVNFSQLGANTYSISGINFFASENGRPKVYADITYRDVRLFTEKYNYPAIVSVNYTATNQAIVKYKSIKTNPKIQIIGSDENYFITSSLEIEHGRNFNLVETRYGANVAVIGSELKKDLFGDGNALGKIITAGSNKFKVVGILKKRGNTFGFSYDDIVIIPTQAARKAIPGQNNSYTITVKVAKFEQLDASINESIALFRMVRKLKPSQENNFDIQKSDSLINIISSQFRIITIITLVISFITLISSAVALMNIMLVSVKERIREIGTMKAIGATIGDIKIQFITEAIIISQIGCVIGIVLGLAIGNIFAYYMGSKFVMPWGWLLLAVVMSIAVGISAGYYPAVKAAKLDPIEALRYE